MKKSKVWVFRTLTKVFAIMTAVFVTLSGVAEANQALINDFLDLSTTQIVANEDSNENSQYFNSSYDSLESMYRAKVALLREIGQEGTVLLKNKDALLPLSQGTVTVLNADAFVFSTQTGGGSMRGSMPSTGIVKALEYDGLTVNTDFSKIDQSDAVILVIARAGNEGNDLDLGSLALTEDEINMLNLAKQACPGRVILLSSGDYSLQLAEQEKDDDIGAIIRFGNAGYRAAYGLADVITGLVSPSGKLVETMVADPRSLPALANYGDFRYDNAAMIETSQAKNYIVYMEGIYSDYKYYETRYEDTVLGQGNAKASAGATSNPNEWSYDDEVVYGYGYGLSYTDFDYEWVGDPLFNESNHTAKVTIKVTNTGSVAAKEVVQVYGQSPYTDYDQENGVEKAAIQLLGFGKTSELSPGQSEEVSVDVHMQWLASYDAHQAKTYIMDAGDYYFSIGNGAHEALNNILELKTDSNQKNQMDASGDATLVYHWVETDFDNTTYAQSVYTDEPITNHFQDVNVNYWLDDNDQVTYLTRSDWQATYPVAAALSASPEMLESLNDTKKYENGKWNDTASRVEIKEVLTSEGGEAAMNAISLRGLDYDDPAWDELLAGMTLEEMSNMVANGRTTIQASPSIMFPGAGGNDSPTGLIEPYRYSAIDPETGDKTPVTEEDALTDGITDEAVNVLSTEMNGGMYPSMPMLAATFNTDLSYRQGEMFGEDALYSGTTFIWGSGANLHRIPYGGRHAEYYSADSVHTTLMAAAQSEGAWDKGAVLVSKHFVANEQEQNRIGVATFLDEQNLRENYLRAFEGIYTYGNGKGLMASYNRLGLIGTASEYDLMTSVLRNEWGSTSYVITDLNGPTAGLYDGNAIIAAGTNTILNNGPYDEASAAYVNSTLNVENIADDPVLLTKVQEACHRMLYVFVNSSAMNGIESNTSIINVTPWYLTLLKILQIVFAVLLIVFAVLYIVKANQKERSA